MSKSVKSNVLELIKSFPDRFIWADRIPYCKRNDVDVALFNLYKSNKIIRITNGLYFYKGRKELPTLNEIAQAIATKNNWSISETEKDNIFLANVPRTKEYTVTGEKIIFRQTTSKNFIKPVSSQKKINYQYLHNTELQDEQYSPKYIVEPLIPYIEELQKKLGKQLTIWCPADTEDSNYYKVLSKLPFCKIIPTHIGNGQNFYTMTPDFEFDCIITNCPFKNKKEWFKRTMSFNKPFALLLPLSWLNDITDECTSDKKLQLLIPDKRTNFIGNKSQAPFKSIYYCWNFLDKDLAFCKLNKNGEK